MDLSRRMLWAYTEKFVSFFRRSLVTGNGSVFVWAKYNSQVHDTEAKNAGGGTSGRYPKNF